MIIENPDAFKSWLTSILEPLCDADPAALAKYVYALVKKDKALSELREGMLDQLDVFLQQETKPFVDMLFKSLESNDYLKNLEMINPLPPTEAIEPEKENDMELHPSNGSLESRAGGATEARSPTAGGAPRHRVVVPRAPAKLAAPAPLAPAAPPLPRAPPHEHTLVKVSQPLTELLEEPVDQPIRRRERRVENLRDKEDRRRRRSRSWERRPRGRRHPQEHNAEVRRRSSRSPSPRGRYRNRSPPAVGPMDRPASRSRSRSPVGVRERDLERERDRLRIPREIERDRMSRDREHMERVTRSRDRDRSRERSLDRGSRSDSPNDRLEVNDAFKRRCRDFDEKGYCMRGDLCQWDHGIDPVVLEDSTLGVLAMPPPVPEYNPLTPDIWSGSMPPYHHGPFGHPPPHPHPHPPSALIPVRIRDVPPPPGTMPLGVPSIPPPRHPMPKKNFDYNRLGPARPPPPGIGGNCSLEVKKVPRGLNDITHLNNHFSKFGKIVNIQVSFEGDPEGALITFSNHTEASVAYKSTEAVLNNRFIKVFWHNPENKSENVAPGGHANKHMNTHPQHQQHPASLNKVLINRDNIKATDNKQQLEKAKAAAEVVNGQEPPTKEAPKPVQKAKQVMEMNKRAQALLQTQLQQQLLLIEKLESGKYAGAQRTALMEAIGSAQEGIEKLRKELVAYNKILKQMQANAKKPKTREEAQKEILDAELDIFTKQQEGQDVTELLKKVAELRRQMTIQFPVHPPMRRPISRGGRFNSAMRFTRGAPAQKVFVNQTVDHRPRALLISGFEADELDSLVTHFSQFGEVTGKEVNLAVPELILQYKARMNAEQAMLRGKNYNDRTLSITWVTNNKTYGTTNATPTPNGDTTDTSTKESEQPTPEASEDVLLRFDEEEEDDAEEDRSWRR